MLLSAPTICRMNVWLPLAVELAVGQHPANGGQVAGALEQGAQPGPVVRRAAFGRLHQTNLARQIHDYHPFAPMAPGTPLATVTRLIDEAGADGSRRQAGCIDGDRRPAVGRRWHQAQRFAQQACYVIFLQATQTAIQRRVVRDAVDPQRFAQLGVLPQAHLRLAIGPVLIAHGAEDRQQAWLRECVFRERAAILRHGGFRDLPGDLGKPDCSNLGHVHTSCVLSLQGVRQDVNKAR
jgi:hypothetical protein